MLLRETIVEVLASSAGGPPPADEVPRQVAASLPRAAGHALILTGLRR